SILSHCRNAVSCFREQRSGYPRQVGLLFERKPSLGEEREGKISLERKWRFPRKKPFQRPETLFQRWNDIEDAKSLWDVLLEARHRSTDSLPFKLERALKTSEQGQPRMFDLSGVQGTKLEDSS